MVKQKICQGPLSGIQEIIDRTLKNCNRQFAIIRYEKD